MVVEENHTSCRSVICNMLAFVVVSKTFDYFIIKAHSATLRVAPANFVR